MKNHTSTVGTILVVLLMVFAIAKPATAAPIAGIAKPNAKGTLVQKVHRWHRHRRRYYRHRHYRHSYYRHGDYPYYRRRYYRHSYYPYYRRRYYRRRYYRRSYYPYYRRYYRPRIGIYIHF